MLLIDCMRKLNLTPSDRQDLINYVSRITLQLETITKELQEDTATDCILTQLLAVKGGASRLCKEIISRAIMKDLHSYSQVEIDQALSIIFRLD
jgi:DNA-binding FrmR family transcriptional regulator